jgi:hypothetical protein
MIQDCCISGGLYWIALGDPRLGSLRQYLPEGALTEIVTLGPSCLTYLFGYSGPYFHNLFSSDPSCNHHT